MLDPKENCIHCKHLHTDCKHYSNCEHYTQVNHMVLIQFVIRNFKNLKYVEDSKTNCFNYKSMTSNTKKAAIISNFELYCFFFLKCSLNFLALRWTLSLVDC